jgi:hypothetical protein
MMIWRRKFPGEIDVPRVRRILEELRRRKRAMPRFMCR